MENQIVKPLETVGGEELLEMQLPPKEFVIEGLLPKGLAMIVGATKIGKSFLSLQVALAVSSGEMLWSFPTNKGHVLYLALEDDLARLQKRVKDMDDNATNNVRFAILAERLHQGLIEQMTSFITDYPDTNLVIIDTLQHIRDNEKKAGGNLYAQDYSELMMLQRFALDNSIAILLVHHTSKTKFRDPLEAASGSNGITAALDTYWLINRPNREDNLAKMTVVSRDYGVSVFKIEMQSNGEWKMIEGQAYEKEKTNQYVSIIAFYLHFFVWADLDDLQPYVTNPTKLIEDIKACGIEPKFNFNSRRIKIELNAHHDQLEGLGIMFDGTRRKGDERLLIFTPITDENMLPYEVKPRKLFDDIKVTIDKLCDVNDDMTTQTYIGQNLDSVVTDDDKSENDITPPVSEVSSLMSLLSQINVNDPDAGDKLVMAAAKSIEAKCAREGTPITPFEDFCKAQEEKERKKKEAEIKYIDVKFSDAAKEISVPAEIKVSLSGKNKIDAAVIFLKAFLLRARLKSA
ncbi:MAG: AAA family ATPase [Ruminococcus sp.]|nr:AAA family ATPase [Ruminococcus sp.]